MAKLVDGEFPSDKTDQLNTKAYGKTIYGPHMVIRRGELNTFLGTYAYITGE